MERGFLVSDNSGVQYLADASLSHNYPMITRSCAFSNYVHLIPQSAMDFSRELGYAQNHTILSDTGGTLFSDALLGYTDTFKSTIPDRQGWEQGAERFGLYHLTGETEHFAVYRNQYIYSAGLTISESALYTSEFKGNPFEVQNSLSGLFFGKELFKIAEYMVLEEKEIDCHVQGKGIVYLYSEDLEAARITVNNKQIPVPDFFYGITGNTYPSFNNNGILSLGCYEDETLHISIAHHSWADNIQDSTVSIGILDFEGFVATTQQDASDCSYSIRNKELQLNINSQGDEYLFIPSLIQGGWQCEINGMDAALESLNDTFLLIPLQKGENRISLKFYSLGANWGILISVIAVLVFFLWILFVKFVPGNQKMERGIRILINGAGVIFKIIFFVYLLLVDIVPPLYLLLMLFHP